MNILRFQIIILLIWLSTSILNIRTESNTAILKTKIKQYLRYSQELDKLITELIDYDLIISKSRLFYAQNKAALLFKRMKELEEIFLIYIQNDEKNLEHFQEILNQTKLEM